jgi:hypothetical protein
MSTDHRNAETPHGAIPLPLKSLAAPFGGEFESLSDEAKADLVREAKERGITVAQAYEQECERRRRIEAITPTEQELASSPSPPPAQWYGERW